MHTRLTSPTLKIDPAREISFTYRGKPLTGVKGDTIATALFANHRQILSRSFKYHRPRGLYSMDGESSSTLMQVNFMPNVRAELTLLEESMVVEPQNITGTPDHDLMAVTEKFSPLMPPGFYYKVFHKPYKLWPFFQNRIRKAAGIGVIDERWEEGTYDARYLNCDLCVVGGGLAGLTAALTAADKGLDVILLESRPWLGGINDWRTSLLDDGTPRYKAMAAMALQVTDHDHIRVFLNTPMTGFYHNNLITAMGTGGDADAFTMQYLEIRSTSVVVATGCLERPLVFENNERPGVMLADCALRLAMHYGLKPGEKAVFSTGHDRAVEAALALADFGVDIVAMADSRTTPLSSHLMEKIQAKGIPFFQGWVAQKALGRKSVQGVVLTALKGDRTQTLACDLLVASAGVHPVISPLLLTRSKPVFDNASGCFTAQSLPENVHVAGRATGCDTDTAIELSGRLAGLKGCGSDKEGVADTVKVLTAQLAELSLERKALGIIRAPVPENKGKGKKCFVCFDEDVTVKDVCGTIDQGFDAVELCKRYSTVGMGPSQSGIPGINLPLIVGEHLNKAPGEMVPSNIRPPLKPTLIAAYVGKNFKVEKKTPLHDVQHKAGAVFLQLGKWKRPRQFGHDESARAEIKAVHEQVGLMDGSTLGKFRIYGPDAIKALNYLYVSDMTTIVPQRLKYAAMCNEDGCLIDDGVIAAVGEDDFYFTTSSGRAAETLAWFRYWTREKNWDYTLVNLTDTLGAINIAGPNARQVLEKIVDDDISNAELPYMGYKAVTIKGCAPARLLRMGFLGELSYEIHAPASFLTAIWEALMEAGKDAGIVPFGLEAQNVLRSEKAHVIIGLDSENKTTLTDVGLGFLWDRKKRDGDAIGIPALRMTEKQTGRTKLVGFEMADPQKIPPDFSLVVDNEIRGHVTGARYSHALGKTIGLALVEDSLAKVGTAFEIYTGREESDRFPARVVKTPFYDPQGQRLRM